MIHPEPSRILPAELDPEIQRLIVAGRVSVVHITEPRARHLQPGDMVWVREGLTFPAQQPGGDWLAVVYGSDARRELIRWPAAIARPQAKWLPASAMPVHASRLTLIVRAVREMRLQQVDEQHAIAAGVAIERDGYVNPLPVHDAAVHADWRQAFGGMWDCMRSTDTLRGGAWSDNPEVTQIRFDAFARNVGDMATGIGSGGAR